MCLPLPPSTAPAPGIVGQARPDMVAGGGRHGKLSLVEGAASGAGSTPVTGSAALNWPCCSTGPGTKDQLIVPDFAPHKNLELAPVHN